jgi:hypothetical protein
MCMCELLVATMMNILIMFKSTKILLNIETVRLEVYLVEGPMLKAPAAPCALIHIVRCSMSRTTVDAGRCSQYSPSNVHWEVDDPRKKKTMLAITRTKGAVVETLPKNLIAHTPEQVSLCGRCFRRPALPTLRAHWGLGRGNSGATQRKNNGAEAVVSLPRSWRQTVLFISTEGQRRSVEDESGCHKASINY